MRAYPVFHEADVVHRREVGVEEAEVALGDGARLEVLVEEREDVRLEGALGHQRRAGPAAGLADEVPVVLRRVGVADADLPVHGLGWPPGLPHRDLHVVEAELLHRRVHRVQLRLEHAGVGDARAGVRHAQLVVRPRQRVGERRAVVPEVRVRVHHERRPALPVERQHRREHGAVPAVAEPARRRRLGGAGKDAQGVRRRDADLAEPRRHQRRPERAHGGHQVGDEGRVARVHDLVPDEDERDVRLGVVRRHVGGHPRRRAVLGRELGDVAVARGDHERDARAGEGADHVRVRVEQLHAVDAGAVGQERRHRRRRREVVALGAVVDADSGGGRRRYDEDEEGHGNNDGSSCVPLPRRRCGHGGGLVGEVRSLAPAGRPSNSGGEGRSEFNFWLWLQCANYGWVKVLLWSKRFHSGWYISSLY